ncbi:L,D-transpeptidase [Streptomyces sp. NPDC059637]|uniref:L,D-transpeptidase n=1 Tax=Streptomyces TaxID=1883 RepID=UPI0031D930EF
MAGIRPGVQVAALTVAALVGVGALAVQAAESAPEAAAQPQATASPSASPTASARPTAEAGGDGAGEPGAASPAVPAQSGSGKRVVYSPADGRVWLVGADGEAVRTFTVVPAPLTPAPGEYRVTSMSPPGGQVQGSDGVPVEHIVRFAVVDGAAVGFSAAVDGSLPTPTPGQQTGGIREKRTDGKALWEFAEVGTPVVVV